MEPKKVNYIHYLVVFALAFFFRFLPPIGQITPYGMGILGTFIAAIYGWTTIGMAWTSFICLTGIGLTIGVNQMIAAGFNATIMAMIFVFLLMAVLDETGTVTWMVNSILGGKFTKGKPWLTLILLFAACYIGGVLNSMVMAIVFVGVFTTICTNLGVKPFTKLPTFLMIGAALSLLMGQIGVPVMGNALMLVATYNAMFPEPLNFAKYMLFMIPMGILTIVFFVGLMRFVFRVDVTPLKNFDPSIVGERKPINKDQKMALMFFVIYMLLIILSSMPLGAVSAFLQKFGMFGTIAMVLCVMMLYKRENGEPFLNFHRSAAKVGWDPVLMVAFIMVISSYMNTEETGISQTIMSVLMPFTTMNPLVFIVIALLFAVILTNVATNLIVVVLIMPVLFNFAGMVGMNSTMLILLLFIFSHLAIGTPAAAPPTGICMTATDIIKPTDMMKYGIICLPLLFIFVLAVGIPFASLIF